jgi:aspartate/glutamate racemase
VPEQQSEPGRTHHLGILAHSVEGVCPDNTAHLALEHPGPELPLPGLHIAQIVAATAPEAGYRRVGVLGTTWTMEAALYPRVLAEHGLEAEIPDASDRARRPALNERPTAAAK